jgi:hypothetical protein
MNIIIKILLFLALFSAFYFGGQALYSQSSSIQAAVGHISLIFNMITGNMKNLHEVFPVYDLALAFGVVIITEMIVVGIKISKFFIKFDSSSK